MVFKELIGLYALRKLLGPKRAEKFDAAARKYAPRIASTVFGLVSIVHSLRLVLGWEVTIIGKPVPTWISVAVVAVAAYLSYSLWPTKRI